LFDNTLEHTALQGEIALEEVMIWGYSTRRDISDGCWVVASQSSHSEFY
jgi:hypothetical protein